MNEEHKEYLRPWKRQYTVMEPKDIQDGWDSINGDGIIVSENSLRKLSKTLTKTIPKDKTELQEDSLRWET